MKISINKKYLRRCIIIIVGVAITIFSWIGTYNHMIHRMIPVEGTVLAKSDELSSGKYPTQKWTIAFKPDNLPIMDVNISFHTYSTIKKGDRITLCLHRDIVYNVSTGEIILEMCMFIITALTVLVLLVSICFIIYWILDYMWNG